jgi:hypothetical protein
MLTSSPTISAPASPSTFHSHARHPYHASRRTSSSAHSPRFSPQVSGASQRRTTITHSPTTTFTRSPQIKKREYADAGTQYTPPGYPPTYHPPSQPPANPIPPATLHQTNTTREEQGDPSASAFATEPPEPTLRIDPQAVPPPQHPRLTRRSSKDLRRGDGEQDTTAGQAGQAGQIDQEQSSAAKRLRPQEPNVKLMPLKYETCDSKDLGVLISDMLMELVRLNDGFPLRDGQLTRFHSR